MLTIMSSMPYHELTLARHGLAADWGLAILIHYGLLVVGAKSCWLIHAALHVCMLMHAVLGA